MHYNQNLLAWFCSQLFFCSTVIFFTVAKKIYLGVLAFGWDCDFQCPVCCGNDSTGGCGNSSVSESEACTAAWFSTHWNQCPREQMQPAKEQAGVAWWDSYDGQWGVEPGWSIYLLFLCHLGWFIITVLQPDVFFPSHHMANKKSRLSNVSKDCFLCMQS